MRHGFQQWRNLPAVLALLLLGGFSGCTHTATRTSVSSPEKNAATGGLFTDVSAQAGLHFTLGHGGRTPLTILETLGYGCAFLDYDNDGWPDILLLGPNKVALYHNNQNGTFTDVTAQSGLKQEGEWQGVATGDYDNDGRTDLFISGYRCCVLYHNEAGAPGAPSSAPFFRDVTQPAGVGSNLWGASACFADVDNDGFLDLIVTHYVKFYPNSVKFCLQGGLMSTCGPTNYDPEKPTLYHNNHNGTFTDETIKRGLGNASGNALGVAIADYDEDGWIDFAIANDQLPGDLYHNKGHGFFENVNVMSGTAYDATGAAHAGMGLDWADVGADGKLALLVMTYQHQAKSLYTQSSPGLFADVSFTAGIAQAAMNYVAFGVKFFDYDNDGLPDILISNGHAVDNIAKTDHTTTYPQITQLFHNVGNGRFAETTTQGGPDFLHPIVGRGVAIGDYDNDGRVDALVVDAEGHPLLLHNQDTSGNNWLALRLRGVKSNRDGIGARLTVQVGDRRWKQVVTTGGSFLSASDGRAHLGLGRARQADRIEIRWPSGHTDTLTNVAGNRIVTVMEGHGEAEAATMKKEAAR